MAKSIDAEDFLSNGIAHIFPPYNPLPPDDLCPICCVGFSKPNDDGYREHAVKFHCCGGLFGSICLETWLESHSTCPHCRAVLYQTPDPEAHQHALAARRALLMNQRWRWEEVLRETAHQALSLRIAMLRSSTADLASQISTGKLRRTRHATDAFAKLQAKALRRCKKEQRRISELPSDQTRARFYTAVRKALPDSRELPENQIAAERWRCMEADEIRVQTLPIMHRLAAIEAYFKTYYPRQRRDGHGKVLPRYAERLVALHKWEREIQAQPVEEREASLLALYQELFPERESFAAEEIAESVRAAGRMAEVHWKFRMLRGSYFLLFGSIYRSRVNDSTIEEQINTRISPTKPPSPSPSVSGTGEKVGDDTTEDEALPTQAEMSGER